MHERCGPTLTKTTGTALLSPFDQELTGKDPDKSSADSALDKPPLLSANEEKILGGKIFTAQLALRNIRRIIDFLPIDQQAKFEEIISTGRGKALLETLDGEIINKEKLLTLSEKEAKDSSVDRLFLDDVDRNDRLTEDQLKQNQTIPEFAQEQLNLFQEGYKAVDSFTNANLRLVVSIAKRIFYGRKSEFDLMDLVQEGNNGLMKAVGKFDYRQGKFSTYATWWIRQSITRAIADKGQAIRFPVHKHDQIRKIIQEQRKLEQEEGREVSFIEAAGELGFDPAKTADLYSLMGTISLDEPIDYGNDGSTRALGDVIPDEQQDVVDQVSKKLLEEAVAKALASAGLSPQEKRIMELRFGLTGERARTLEKTSGEFGVTRERIRQVEAKALMKLRANPEMKKLRDWPD